MDHFYPYIQGWFTFPGLYKQMVDRFPEGSHFVEVGAWLGKSTSFMAVEILNSGKCIDFDVVDTWGGSNEITLYTKEEKETLYKSFLQNMAPVNNIVNPIRMHSVDAAKLYEDKSLDFVFIDAGHEYDEIMSDLNAWYPKVKNEGIIAGHDYFFLNDSEHGWKYPGVRDAVNIFFNNKALVSGNEYCWLYNKQD
jgi:Methyltransferase domain